MAECDVSELLSDGAHLSASEPVQQIYRLALLCSIATTLNPAMTCDPQTLLSEGAAFACLSPELQRIAELQLLCEISGTTAALNSQVQCGTVNPTEAPVGGCGLFVNTATEELLFWNGTTWVLKA